MLFYHKTMINNINNFGVINFYENGNSSKKEQACPQQIEDVTPARKEQKQPKKEQAYTPQIPKENDYNAVREYVTERKKYDSEFRQSWENHTLKQNCIYLTKEFGWIVDEHSLGANLNRHR